jgi:hypothetical protein
MQHAWVLAPKRLVFPELRRYQRSDLDCHIRLLVLPLLDDRS